ncbi:flagellar protein FlaG [Maricaulis parjimensis]|uniref:flagellar protein FlaG n=1 Tax=Maricaulis parjimensis TaxID=144023 RepID=UPI0019394E4D
MTSYTENRDLHADRPRETAARVDPVEHTDKTATDTPQQREERAAEIERLANDALRNSRLKILQDENNGDYIYMMVDEDTGEQIRRWPPEKHGDLMEYLRTKTAGLLDAKA